MTTVYLIRHAERDTVPDLLPGRAPGVHLSDEGRMQANRLAERMKHDPVHQIFSSPLERAVESAAPLARDRQLAVQLAPALNEIDFGAWTNRRVGELLGDHDWRHFNQFRSGSHLPGGERALDVQHRMVGELLRWREIYPEQAIACFSHAEPIRLALMYFLGMPVDFFDRIEIAPASISVLTLAEWGARILRLNDGARE